MKKNKLFFGGKALLMLALAAGSLAFTSCAQDGYDDDERWDNGVYNTQLEAPAADDITITASADGTQQTISWPVVNGAGGYHAVLTNTTAGEVVKDTIIDGVSFATARVEDTFYELSLSVLGNEEHNNTGSETVSKSFNTYAEALATIPSGSDLYTYFQENPLPELRSEAVYYNLEAGGTYTLSGVLDFGDQYVALRAIGGIAQITCSDGAYFKFGNGIRVENVNIDNTDNTANGLFTMSDTPNESQSIESLGYKDKGANQSGYIMTNPVYLKNIKVKNLKKSFVYGNKKNWSLTNLLISDCIVQLNNADNSSSVINLYGASNGLIQNMSVTNCTFFNLQQNDGAYFIRYSNSSNAQPKKIFGEGSSATLSITHSTFANVFTDKDFANNLANTNTIETILTDNIFYDVFRVYQFVQTNTVRTATNNYVWWVNTSKQTNDTSRTDSNGNPLCTEADPGFPTIESLSALDFNETNGGANFTPSGTPLANNAGDPRWLPAN